MARQITVADVDQAEAALAAVKSRRSVKASERQAAAEKLAELRSAFRAQEEAAGRRSGLVSTED